MRLFKKNNGYYYFEAKRGHAFSLRTMDKSLATKKAKLLRNEYELINVYDKIIKAQTVLIAEINGRQTAIQHIMYGDKPPEDRSARCIHFKTEEEMQSSIMPILETMGLSHCEQYKKCSAGTMDAVAFCGAARIIVEFKIGTVKETSLGQCIRYLNSKDISADELWLIGEGVRKKDLKTFALFPKIKIFVASSTKNGTIKLRNACSGQEIEKPRLVSARN